GTLKWKFRAAGTIFSDPAIALDGTIYFGCDDDKLYALNPNGTRKWTFDTGGPITASPAIGSKGTVYIGTTTAMKFFAVNPDGSKAWEFQAAERIYSSAALAADGTIYFGSNDGHLYALDEIGTLKWKFAAGALVRSSPAIAADGTVYFGVENGAFFAINASGDLSWSVLTENYIYSSPVIDPMGAIYFASADNSVYALTGAARLAGTPWSMFRSDPRHLGRAVPMMDSPPALSPIADVTILKNEVAGPIAFTVQDSETPAENLLSRVETSDPVLVPEANITLNGSGSNRSLTLTPAPEQTGSATITIYVMDSAGHTASTRFTLTVLPGDPVPAPRILSVEISGGAVTILWTSVPGEIYQVQSASDLVSPRWENLPGEVVAQEESASKKDLAELEQQKFYRVVHLP
ncbi:MAG: PQQ-binding-like beta-propeller repeat protein, partial [Verrucomicrobiota bacterium]